MFKRKSKTDTKDPKIKRGKSIAKEPPDSASDKRKPNILVRIIVPAYFRNSWRELRMVTWPTWKLSRQLTVAVLIFAVIFAGLIGLVDWGLDKAFKVIFLK